VGGPKWDHGGPRPEAGLLALRKELGLFANLRPVAPHRSLLDASTLKPSVLEGVDLLLVRELTSGIYFGRRHREPGYAVDTCEYTSEEVARVVRVAARLARGRKGKLCSVDKANVLDTSRLWREVTTQVMHDEFPDVELSHLLVDACAMHLIREPARFDVIVTENLFGDILSDEAAMLTGSIGMLPSASLGDRSDGRPSTGVGDGSAARGGRPSTGVGDGSAARGGLYEPIHGSAPDLAGKGVANPYGTILSVALLLRHSLSLLEEAAFVESAVALALEQGALTKDLGGVASCAEAGAAVLAAFARAEQQQQQQGAR
jgi:3-isopropylmalate dehydrogenase